MPSSMPLNGAKRKLNADPSASAIRKYPQAPLFAAAYSLGSLMLCKYLGESDRGKGSRLQGAVMVSNPCCMFSSQNKISVPWTIPWIFNLVLTYRSIYLLAVSDSSVCADCVCMQMSIKMIFTVASSSLKMCKAVGRSRTLRKQPFASCMDFHLWMSTTGTDPASFTFQTSKPNHSYSLQKTIHSSGMLSDSCSATSHLQESADR